MELVIKIDQKAIGIILLEGRKIIAKTSFFDEHNLTEKLLKSIDVFLKKNKLEIADIKKARLVPDSGGSLTSNRIAKTIVDTINWANSRTRKI